MMAKTIRQGYFLNSGGSTQTLHSAAGRLLAVFVSHAQTTVQTVVFYDNTAASGTMIFRINLDPTNSPVYIEFPRDQAIAFSTGLHVDQGNCNVNVWSIDYG